MASPKMSSPVVDDRFSVRRGKTVIRRLKRRLSKPRRVGRGAFITVHVAWLDGTHCRPREQAVRMFAARIDESASDDVFAERTGADDSRATAD